MHNSRNISKRYLNAHGPRKGHSVIGIIIHCISAIDVAPTDPFDTDKIIDVLNQHHVSADYLIDRSGGILRLIPPGRYAYHAGYSRMPTGEAVTLDSAGTSVNKITIGIELVGTYTSGYTCEQYVACAWLCKKLIRKYPVIDRAHIVGHEHVAPQRKFDPGEKFDWDLFYELLGLGTK